MCALLVSIAIKQVIPCCLLTLLAFDYDFQSGNDATVIVKLQSIPEDEKKYCVAVTCIDLPKCDALSKTDCKAGLFQLNTECNKWYDVQQTGKAYAFRCKGDAYVSYVYMWR